MQTLLLTFCLIMLSIAGLAVGIFFGRTPIKGSCGGLACTDGGCGACSRKKDDRA